MNILDGIRFETDADKERLVERMNHYRVKKDVIKMTLEAYLSEREADRAAETIVRRFNGLTIERIQNEVKFSTECMDVARDHRRAVMRGMYNDPIGTAGEGRCPIGESTRSLDRTMGRREPKEIITDCGGICNGICDKHINK